MSGKPSPLTASAARAPPGISATGGERDSSARTGSAGISIRVLIASPRSPRRAAGRGRVRTGQAAVPVNGIREPGTSSRTPGWPPIPPGRLRSQPVRPGPGLGPGLSCGRAEGPSRPGRTPVGTPQRRSEPEGEAPIARHERGGAMSFNLAVILRESAQRDAGPAGGGVRRRPAQLPSARPGLGPGGGQPGRGRDRARRPDRAAAAQHPAVPDLLLRNPQGGRRRGAAQRPAQGTRDRLPPRGQRSHGPDHLGRGAGRGGQGRRGRRDRYDLRGRAPGRRAGSAAVRAAARRRGATASRW